MNLEALMGAIAEKEACQSRKTRAIKQLSSDREMISKINQNKFTVKTMFKSKSQKADHQVHLMASID